MKFDLTKFECLQHLKSDFEKYKICCYTNNVYIISLVEIVNTLIILTEK